MTGLAAALLPPASLAVLALLLLPLRPRWAVATMAVLVILSVEGVSRLLVAPLMGVPPSGSAPPAAIVVLAGDDPDLLSPGRDAPGLETLQRLRTAAALARRTALPILLSSGREPDGPVPPATLMARSLRDDFGVGATWREPNSDNVWQSAAASAAMLREAGVTAVYLVTQATDARLAAAVYRSAGLGVTSVTPPHGDPLLLDATVLAAYAPGWLTSANAIQQWAGLACQAVHACAAAMRSGLAVRPDPS